MSNKITNCILVFVFAVCVAGIINADWSTDQVGYGGQGLHHGIYPK